MDVESSDGETFRLIYRSHSRMPAANRKADLGKLFTVARSNNKARHITGALLLSGDWFVQTLEGDELRVRSLFERIEKDPRHHEVSLLEAGAVEERAFPRWAMAQVGEGETEDTYLIAHENGIAPAAGRGTTPAQETVLDAMRSAAKDAAHAT